jgi:bifunctional non-homologous end joining protein LigD
MAYPDWIKPMAATLTERRFTGAEWLFERKFDGIRLLAFKQADEVRLLSRNRLAQEMPMIAAAIRHLPVRDVILDGEVTWDRGSAYHVFDVLWLNGQDVMSLPLEARRALLSGLPLSGPLHRVEELDFHEHWTEACRQGWEGVIAKRRNSVYEQRRSKHWLKMKCEIVAELTVGGFTDPQGGRQGLGALLVGHHVNDEFVFAGRVGTGFDRDMLIELRQRLDALLIDAPPFTRAKGLPRIRAHWVTPSITVRVAFIEWTVHGKLRHSRLLEVTS